MDDVFERTDALTTESGPDLTTEITPAKITVESAPLGGRSEVPIDSSRRSARMIAGIQAEKVRGLLKGYLRKEKPKGQILKESISPPELSLPRKEENFPVEVEAREDKEKLFSTQELITFTEDAIQEQGYSIDVATPPFKSFNPEKRERFYIQKAQDREGRSVVVKVSGQEDRDPLKKEAKIYELIDLIPHTPSSIAGLDVHFPQKLAEFTTARGQEAIVTTFEKDDLEYKRSLTPTQRTDVLIAALDWIGKQEVPQKLIADQLKQRFEDRTVGIINSEQVIALLDRHIPALVQAQILDKEIGDQLLQSIKANKPALAIAPLVLAHGDFHMGNLAVSQDAASGNVNVGILDVESLFVSNKFYDIAHIANRLPIFKEMFERPDIMIPAQLRESLQDVMGSMDDPQLITTLEQRFITDDNDRKVYQAMKIYDAVNEIYRNHRSQDPLIQTSLSLYKKNLLQELAA